MSALSPEEVGTGPDPAPLLIVPAAKVTASDVKEALRHRHPSGAGAWVCVEEAFSGFATSQTGGIDLLAIGAWKSAKAPGLPGCGRLARDYRADDPTDWQEVDARNALVAYEVKVSRSDFKREIYGYHPGEGTKWNTRHVPKWPGKAQWALDRVNYFLFATPRGLLHDDEIDRTTPWGEGEAPRRGALYLPEGIGLVEVDGRGCRVRRPATLRSAPIAWTRHETAELLRRVDYTSFARGRDDARQTA